MRARRLGRADTDDLRLTLDLIKREFSYMDGVVDPPSSMHRLTMEDLTAEPGETWVIGTPPVACVMMTPMPQVLYLGKLAVAATERNRGLARLLLDRAEVRARELGVSWIELLGGHARRHDGRARQCRLERKSDSAYEAVLPSLACLPSGLGWTRRDRGLQGL